MVYGNVSLGNDSITEIHIHDNGVAGVDYSILECSGNVNLDGTLVVRVSANCDPSNSTFAVIAGGAGFNGGFKNISAYNRVSSADGRGSFAVSITGNLIVLNNWSQQQVPVPAAPVANPAVGTGMTRFYAN